MVGYESRLEFGETVIDTFILIPSSFDQKFLLVVSMVEKTYNELRGELVEKRFLGGKN